MRRREITSHGGGQRHDRRFGQVAIALGNDDRVPVRGDQLHAKREAALANHPPHPVERDVDRVAGNRGGEARGKVGGVGRGRERAVVDQPVEQRRPPRQLVGQRRRMGQDLRDQRREPRPRLEQAVEIDPARQPLDEVAEAVERALRVGPRPRRAHQIGQHRFERRARRRRPQRPRAARSPVADTAQRFIRLEAHRDQFGTQDVGVVRQALAALADQPVELHANPVDMPLQRFEQSRAAFAPVKPRHLVEPIALGRQAVLLAVVDHLHAMLGGAQRAISVADRRRDGRVEPVGKGQRGQRSQRRRRAQARVAPAVDELLHLGKELGLANAAAPALEVIAGAEPLALGEMVADAQRNVANFVDRPEIERAAPDERLDLGEEALAQRHIARRGPRANERRALPRQRRAFIIRNRRPHRQHDRRHFGRRAKPQVDPRDIAVAGPLLEQFDQPPAIAHRRFAGIVARAARHGRGVEQQNQVDIGGIIELAAAQFAKCEHRHAGRLGIGHALEHRRPQRAVDRFVGEIAKTSGDLFERQFPGQIAQRHRQRETVAPPSQRDGHRVAGRRQRRRDRGLRPVRDEARRHLGPALGRRPQERTMGLRARNRAGPFLLIHCRKHATVYDAIRPYGETD